MEDMSPETAWKATLGELELQMTKATFNTWLKDARLLAKEENEFVIGVRNDYAKDWLENRLHDTILRTLTAISRQPVTIRFVVWSDEIIAPPAKVLKNGAGKRKRKITRPAARNGSTIPDPAGGRI